MPKLCPVCASTYPDTLVFCPADGSPLRHADAAADLVGTVIADRYLIKELLGRGGMGEVYRARHVRLPREVAIKVLKAELVADAGAVSRFNQEAASAAQIASERVASVSDYGETPDGLVYLAMEFVPGRTLRKLLEEEGPMPVARAVALVSQVAEGLEAAHRLGIVHRDIKPDNIMVVSDGEELRCKVVDFGIAKVAQGQRLTGTGLVVGTREYMSPEQLVGEELDGRSDVYSLAILAYECLTGDLPFDQNTPDRGMSARLVKAPRRLEEIRKDRSWPPALQAALDGALEREVAKRTPSATAFAKALAASVSARREEKAPVAPRSSAPRPGWMIPAAVAAVVVVAGGAAWMLRGGAGPAPAGGAVTPPTAGSPGKGSEPPTGGAAGSASGSGAKGAAGGAAGGAAAAPSVPPKPPVATPPRPAEPVLTAAAARQGIARLGARVEGLAEDEDGAASARKMIPELKRLVGAVRGRPDSAEGLKVLALAHAKAGQTSTACQLFQQAGEKAKGGDVAETARLYREALGCR